MKIVVDYKESIGTQMYMNDITEAMSIIKKDGNPSLERVEFVNYPVSDVSSILEIIKDTVSTGKVVFGKTSFSYYRGREPLYVQI